MCRRYVLVALLAVAGVAPAADRFSDLTMYLPTHVNAAVVADVQAIYASPLAQKGKWATDRPLPLPPSIATVALAARIDADDFSGGRWEVGAARMKTRLTMQQIAEREKGAVDTIAGASAVLSARNAYFVDYGPGIVGMMYPADRQELGRWIREVRNTPLGTVHLPPFLKSAVAVTDPKTHFVMALDLTDAVTPDDLRKKIGSVPLIGSTPNVNGLITLLSGVHGAKLTLTVTAVIGGELRFVFAESPAPLVPLAKPLLAEFLTRRGASMEGFDGWTAEANGNELVLTGSLPERGLRRILTLIAPPAPPADHGDSPLGSEIKGVATTRYFNSIQTLLSDLQKPTKSTEQDYTKFAVWYDWFAQKVEQLPTYNVDMDVVKYGQATATRLRGIGASLRGDVVDVQALEKSITITPYFYASGGWGWRRSQPGVWLQTNEGEVRAQQQEAIAKGSQVRQDLWSRIENETGTLRQTLAERYKETSGK